VWSRMASARHLRPRSVEFDDLHASGRVGRSPRTRTETAASVNLLRGQQELAEGTIFASVRSRMRILSSAQMFRADFGIACFWA